MKSRAISAIFLAGCHLSFSAGEAQGVFKLNETAEVEAKALMAGIHGAMLAARAFDNPAVFDQIAYPLINKVVKTA